MNDLIDLQSITMKPKNVRRSMDRSSEYSAILTSDVKPLFRKDRLRNNASEANLSVYKSNAGIDEISSAEAKDKLDQFNKYLLNDRGLSMSKSVANLNPVNKNLSYLKNTKDLQAKREKFVL